MDKNFEDSINKTPGLSAQQEERMEMRYQHIIASPRKEPVKTVRLGSSWPWMAVAAAVTLIIVSLVVLMKNDAGINQPLQELAVTRVVHSGQQQAELVELPDGTKVILNKDSELTYDSATFGVSTREVTLTGEAYFDVTHDAERRFVVKTGAVSTQVLGTAFNINAYPGQSEITVTVERGVVQVGAENQVYGKIKPNEQIAVNTETKVAVQKNVIAAEVLQWMNNYITLADVSLEEAAGILSEKFNVRFKFENVALKKCRFAGSFEKNEELKEVLTIISIATGVKHNVEGDTVLLYGNGCN